MSRAVDDAMSAHAARRGAVTVHGRPATLIAWKPHRTRSDGSKQRRNVARIDFGYGPITVKPDEVSVLEVAT